MTEPRRRRITKFLYALVGGVTVLGALASLNITGVCACATVVEEVLMYSAIKTDPDSRKVLQKVAERRFPIGTPEAKLIEQIGIKRYAKYCLQARGGTALVCLFPNDQNFWRDTHVQLGFAFDAEHRVKSVRAEPIVRYSWF